ncbi:MAG: TetR/AcrR family transcriptional regulator [Treponema sp.]|jgi:AcrR family transcriptional regulator|nr:TetR/AcrR family transcriptional regulator [Treponema sp.]
MTKGDIIQAAFKVWGRGLYRNTSLSQVSEELGVSKPALYRHFRNKQALLDAMYESFFDDYTGFIRPYYEKALASPQESFRVIVQAMMKYYTQNGYAFTFSLINVWGNSMVRNMKEPLLKRGINMELLRCPVEKPQEASLWLFAVASLIFAVAHFHFKVYSAGKTLSDTLIDQFIASVTCIVSRGLNFNPAVLESLDYETLENSVTGKIDQIEEDPLLRGVAEAVAQAGPWKASMEMVARHSGLSKSGLYAHFKSKEEMMGQLFFTEFNRIVDFALKSQRNSAKPEEQFYLGIFSIAACLRSRPNILLAMDWLRTRRIDPAKFNLTSWEGRIFQDIHFPADYGMSPEDDGLWIFRWIFFLILTILMHDAFMEQGSWFSQKEGEEGAEACRFSLENFARIPNESFRTLYRFIAFGVKGFYT